MPPAVDAWIPNHWIAREVLKCFAIFLVEVSEKALATHSRTLAWKIPWTEEPGRLQSMGSLESDTTERLHFHFSLSCMGEGNDNPLQCSCLENPRDGGAWWASVYGVAQSRTRLKQLSSSSNWIIADLQCFRRTTIPVQLWFSLTYARVLFRVLFQRRAPCDTECGPLALQQGLVVDWFHIWHSVFVNPRLLT